MKMYVKPSIEVIELQLKENIAAVPTTVYKGGNSESHRTFIENGILRHKSTGIGKDIIEEYELSTL